MMGKQVCPQTLRCAFPPLSGPGLQGQESLRREDREDCGKQLHPRAREGHGQPTVFLGSLYQSGFRVSGIGQVGRQVVQAGGLLLGAVSSPLPNLLRHRSDAHAFVL